MEKITCPKCKEQIGDGDASCQRCGRNTRRASYAIPLGIIFSILFVALIGINSNHDTNKKPAEGKNEPLSQVDKNRAKAFDEMLKDKKFLNSIGIEGYDSFGNCLRFKANFNWRMLRADSKKQFLAIAYVGWRTKNKRGYIQVKDAFNDKLIAEYDYAGISIKE